MQLEAITQQFTGNYSKVELSKPLKLCESYILYQVLDIQSLASLEKL